MGLSTSAFFQLGLLDFNDFSVGGYAYRFGRLTVRAGRPEGWNDGKGKDDGVKILTGAVGVMVFEVFAGFADAGGQAKRRGGGGGRYLLQLAAGALAGSRVSAVRRRQCRLGYGKPSNDERRLCRPYPQSEV